MVFPENTMHTQKSQIPFATYPSAAPVICTILALRFLYSSHLLVSAKYSENMIEFWMSDSVELYFPIMHIFVMDSSLVAEHYTVM